MAEPIVAPVKQVDFLALVYGSIAFSLGKTDDGTTHKWTIYVRGSEGQDLSTVLSKVVFKLHPTCTAPIVECTQYPYETTQSGWGEFPCLIEISFKDEKLAPISFTHNLKLHHPGVPVGSSSKPVVHETYDEVVFRETTPEYLARLQVYKNAPAVAHDLSPYWTSFSDQGDLLAIRKAHSFVKTQLELVINEYGKVDTEIHELLAKVAVAKATAAARATSLPAQTGSQEAKNDDSVLPAVVNVEGDSGIEKATTSENKTAIADNEPEAKRVKLEPT